MIRAPFAASARPSSTARSLGLRSALPVVMTTIALAVLAACSHGGGDDGAAGATSAAATAKSPSITGQPQTQAVKDGQSAQFAVVADGIGLTYQWMRNGVPIPGATQATLSIDTAQLSDDNSTYTVAISNDSGTVISDPVMLTVQLAMPQLNETSHPTSVTYGQRATLTAVASGTGPMTFQWTRNGSAIAGATSATYLTDPATAGDDGAVYQVVVTNAAGSASEQFTLAVTDVPVAPTLAANPVAQTVRAGNAATFSVTPAGTAPFSYQWLRNGAAITGATDATYSLGSAALSDDGAQYSVTISNAGGTMTSTPVALSVTPQPGIALFAGNLGGPGTLDGAAASASFEGPTGIAMDNAGNLYITDRQVGTVRKVSAAGIVTTLAGVTNSFGTADGTGPAAQFSALFGSATDSAGNLFVADQGSQTIRKITPAGVVTTFAGSASQSGGNDGTGSAARFNNPTGIAIDAADNLYIADSNANTVRKITPAGVVTTLAGSYRVTGTADGTGSAARFQAPFGIAVSPAGTVYLADRFAHDIRMITPAGVVTTLAGSPSSSGSADGHGSAAQFADPTSLTVDAAGNVWVLDTQNQNLGKITPAGDVTTVAGQLNDWGYVDGAGSIAKFSGPWGITTNGSDLFIADGGNAVIRKVTQAGVVSTIAGAPALTGTADGTGGDARFSMPGGLASDAAGNVYVADSQNNLIRRVSKLGVVTTLAGTGVAGHTDGAAAAATFNYPNAVAVDGAGNVYVSDAGSSLIRMISASGVVTTLAGQAGVNGTQDGVGSAATFSFPATIAVDPSGNVYVGDAGSNLVRKIAPDRTVTTVAGQAYQWGNTDGHGSAAQFAYPSGMACDPAGNVYLSDGAAKTVRKITPAGDVTTLAGLAWTAGTTDGSAATTRFSQPGALSFAADGALYLSDDRTVRRLQTDGTSNTVAGISDAQIGVKTGSLPGHLSAAQGLTVDRNGTLYLTQGNGLVRIALP